MMQLLIATTNPGKLNEIRAYLKHLPMEVRSLHSLENFPPVVEDGKTFQENALKKARTLAVLSGLPTLADDSGLAVDALNGAPGIYSARYAGEQASDADNNQKLLYEMRDIRETERSARFICALGFCDPRNGTMKTWTVRETCEGRVGFNAKGENGFGYDPLFFFPPYQKTFGEIDRETKAKVSHRGKALEKFAQRLPTVVDLRSKP